MKVLLIAPHKAEYVYRVGHPPSVGLLCIAAVLRQAGHEPVIIDLNVVHSSESVDRNEFCARYVIDMIEDLQPGMIGVNCFTAARFPFVRHLAGTIKQKHPSLPIVIGGMHPTLFFQEILENCPSINAIILGEGEYQAVALAEAYSSGVYKKIEALAYRDNNGQIIHNPRKSYINNLDSLPTPAWDLIKLEDYYSDHSTWHNPRGLEINMSVPIYTSRSCPYDCNFCSSKKVMGRGMRLRSPERVVDEMEILYQKYGQNYFGFIDDILTLNKKHILNLCNEIIRRRMVIQLESSVGYNLNSLDEEVIDAMVQAGCTYMILPIEHGNDRIRNEIIGKRLPRDKIFEVAAICKRYNVLTGATCIMGFPEDTNETLTDTLDLLKELQLDINNVLNIIPFPGTNIFDRAVREGLLFDEIDPGSLWEANMIMDAKGRQFYIKPYNMSLEELNEFRVIFDSMRFNSERVKQLRENTSVTSQN